MIAKPKLGSDNLKEVIRHLVEEVMIAVRAKSVEGAVAPYAADVVAYDLVKPLEHRGIDSLKQRLDQWFSSFDGQLEVEFRDLEITASDEVAFCHGLHHVKGTTIAGKRLEMWWRTTLCLSKVNDTWTITHSHDSIPFDMKSGIASMDLKP